MVGCATNTDSLTATSASASRSALEVGERIYLARYNPCVCASGDETLYVELSQLSLRELEALSPLSASVKSAQQLRGDQFITSERSPKGAGEAKLNLSAQLAERLRASDDHDDLRGQPRSWERVVLTEVMRENSLNREQLERRIGRSSDLATGEQNTETAQADPLPTNPNAWRGLWPWWRAHSTQRLLLKIRIGELSKRLSGHVLRSAEVITLIDDPTRPK